MCSGKQPSSPTEIELDALYVFGGAAAYWYALGKTWRADVRGRRVTLYAVGEPARLARDVHGFLAVLVEGEHGEEALDKDNSAVLIVRSRPSPEQVELLVAAVEAGYMVEPKIAGDPWPDVDDERERVRPDGGGA